MILWNVFGNDSLTKERRMNEFDFSEVVTDCPFFSREGSCIWICWSPVDDIWIKDGGTASPHRLLLGRRAPQTQVCRTCFYSKGKSITCYISILRRNGPNKRHVLHHRRLYVYICTHVLCSFQDDLTRLHFLCRSSAAWTPGSHEPPSCLVFWLKSIRMRWLFVRSAGSLFFCKITRRKTFNRAQQLDPPPRVPCNPHLVR